MSMVILLIVMVMSSILSLLFFILIRNRRFMLKSKTTANAIDAMSDAFIVLDNKFRFQSANHEFFEIFPMFMGIAKGQSIDCSTSWPKELQGFERFSNRKEGVDFSLSGSEGIRYYNASINSIISKSGNISGWVMMIRDTSELVTMMNQLESVANTDSLTGVLNRHYFMKAADKQLQKSQRNKRPCSIIIIDLDFFKKINDTYGHLAGDEILKTVARNIKKVLRPYDLLARYGGEEFIIFVDTDEKTALQLAIRIKNEISERVYKYKGSLIRCTASFGIAKCSDNSSTLETIIHNADICLFRAKSNGRNRIEMYSVNEMISELMYAVEDNFKGFQLLYQPIFSTHSSRCIGAEGLLRWESPRAEMLKPDSFIPIIQKLGLMNKVEKWVLDTACAQCRKWVKLFGYEDFSIHVNLTAGMFNGGSMYKEVIRAVERNNITPDNLVLEFKDSNDIKRFYKDSDTLEMLRDVNIRIAIDGFGNGNSPFNVIKDTNVDEVRVDMSYVEDIDEDLASRKLLTGIINMLKSMDHQICVVGVETDLQKKFLQEQSVDSYQGYLLGMPVDPVMFEEMHMNRIDFI